MHERSHNCANNSLTYTVNVHVAVEDNKTRPVVSCNSSHTCTNPPVTSVCFWRFRLHQDPVPYMIHPHLLVLTLSGGRERGCPGLGRSFTLPVWWTRYSRRVTVDTLQPNVAAIFLSGYTHHEHLKSSVSFIFWEPWHDRTETYSTSNKLFLNNSMLPMPWRNEKVENLHLSCSTWFTCIFYKIVICLNTVHVFEELLVDMQTQTVDPCYT